MMPKKEELWGKKFGKLIVIKLLPEGKCRCVCECGSETDILRGNLTSGHTKSCGCLQGGVVGKKIGKFYVDSEVRKNYYKCICECGNVEIRSYKSLTNKGEHKCKSCTAEAVRLGRKKSEIINADYVNGTQISHIGKMTSANKSGVVGVNWDKSKNKWQATIRYQGRKIYLGHYEKFDDAVKARQRGEEKVFDEIENSPKPIVYTFKNDKGSNIIGGHSGNIVGARKKAREHAKKYRCTVYIIKNDAIVDTIKAE